MQPISRVDQVLLLLRKQLAGRTPRTSPASTGNAAAHAQGRAGDEPLAETLSRRVAELRAAGMSDRRSLGRVLLEQMLLNQFGRELMNDASFQRVVDAVHRELEMDPVLAELLDSLDQI
jgi:hypothetical protein